MRHPGLLLQARVASTRLPFKALERLGGRPIVEQCLRRLIASGAGRVVLATTERPEDAVLASIADLLGVAVFRGDTDDVLGRFVRCADTFLLDPIVRATGDNPAVDVLAPGRVLEALRTSGADYVREEGLPYGAAVEAVTVDALRRASSLAQDAFDREHVTTFIRREPSLFHAVELRAPEALLRPDLRLTVDTREDLKHVRDLWAHVDADMPSLEALIAVASRNTTFEAA